MATRTLHFLLMGLVAVDGWGCRRTGSQVPTEQAKTENTPAEPVAERIYSKETTIDANSSLYRTLKLHGFTGSEIHRIVSESKPVINLGKLPGRTQMTLQFSDFSMTDPTKIQIKLSPTRVAWLVKDQTTGAWSATLEEKNVVASPVSFKGLVSSTLWDSAEDAGMPGSVVNKLAEVFAWQIDFNRELRIGDEWRLTVEKLTVDDQHVGWGNVLAAEYLNGQNSFVAVRYPAVGKALGYFAPDGSNVKKLFLKSPLPFGRITSGFSAARMHPILGVNQPHNGVDYGAPVGTPVYAVGAGTVQERTFRNTTGNHVRIRHNSIYETGYSHLKGFASGLKVGAKVEQGQLIGYVGATGLATGPHLHFSFFERGRFVDPLGIKFPSADPVPAAEMAAFQAVSSNAMAALPSRFTIEEKTELAQMRYGSRTKDDPGAFSN